MTTPDSAQPKSSRGRIWRFFWIIYLLLLIGSHVVRWTQSDFSPREYQEFVSLPVVSGDSFTDDSRRINLSFADSASPAETGAADSTSLPIAILLHGSPVASSSLMQMHRSFVEMGGYRVITPDLPGFEGSSTNIPNYSVRSHARYLGAMMDSLGIDEAHLVGYSMSGGVVIEGMRLWPEKIKSVILLSGIGVQEMELLGDYYMNHSVHALQLATLWLITEGFPHFGWMDDAILGVSYARNFFDTDQRPLRNLLSEWEKPLLIMHGATDRMVPYSAAVEHHRIVPQSELMTFEDQGHGIPFVAASRAVDSLVVWIEKVERGEASIRSGSSEDRLLAASRPFDPSDIPPATGVSLILLMFLIAASTMVNEDLASIGAGLMAARGTMGIEHALIAAFFGILIGDILLYASGRVIGRRIVSMAPFSWFIDSRKMARGESWFERKGARVIIASRFVPGTRLPTYVAAGVLKAPFWKFVGYFLIATVVWTPLIVGVSAFVGEQLMEFWTTYESYAIWALLALVFFLYAFVQLVVPVFSHRGRRKLLSTWRRWTRWEFWPPFIFYPPLILRIIKLAFEHRSIMVFTAANPAIESGGFLGESKAQILSLLSGTPEVVARYGLVSSGENAAAQAIEEMRTLSLVFPVVLKPDVGDRGHFVRIVHSEVDIEHYFSHFDGDVIIQEYIEGEEYGIFYVRHPSEDHGMIFSITEKKLVSVVGNGRDTLERLIMDDDRAVNMSRLFFRRHALQLDDVIPENKVYPLVSIGTHSRGALFLDGGYLLTVALEQEINRIAVPMEGFFFGRFDVRVPSTAHLERGEGIKIMEVNGVSSEATHVYDPSTPLRHAYRVLGHQWRLAFQIGQANMRDGHRPSRFRDVMRQIYLNKINPRQKPDKSSAAVGWARVP